MRELNMAVGEMPNVGYENVDQSTTVNLARHAYNLSVGGRNAKSRRL